METKYYDLIISLIKQHKKYPGCESILEDIANDVYEHAKVVIDSVTNEEIITAYLNKVVSTSIVTVPKKMNFNKKKRHRIITTIAPQATEIINEEECEEIVTEETIPENILAQEEPEIEENLDTELNIDENSEEILEDNSAQLENETVTQVDFIEQDINELQEPENTPCDTVDKTLVDKMINGVQNTNVIDTIAEDNQEVEELTEIYESLEEVDALEDLTTDNSTEEQAEITTEILEEVDTEVIEDSDFLENDDINNLDQIDSFEVIDLDEPVTAFEIEDIVENIEEKEDDVNNLASYDILEEIDSTEDLLEENNLTEEAFNVNFTSPSYNCFEYEPSNTEYDAEEILLYLKELDEKHPNWKVLEMCNLKYYHRLSVQEIAEKLNFTIDDVIDILNEIIDAVKD